MSQKFTQASQRKNLTYQKEINPVKQNLETLEGKDKKDFLKGAEIAYETILTAFASGDTKIQRSFNSNNEQ